MRRAATFFIATLLAAGLIDAARAGVEHAPDVIDGSGFVNYMQRPHFTIGEWVKYRTTSQSARGYKDDYTVTILVAGEEVFWGEPCVWIETWTEQANGRRNATASLVSYSAFGDTMADRHLMWFVRKAINGYLDTGRPDVSLITRDKTELKLRRVNWEKDVEPLKVDSLGTDTTTVPAGSFDVYKVSRGNAHAETAEQGDSTTYYERRTTRTFFYTPKVPITNLARIDIDDQQRGKTWLAGRFDKRALNMLERAQGSTVLVGYGKSGVTPVMVPASEQHLIDRKLVDEALSMPPMPAVVERSKRSGS